MNFIKQLFKKKKAKKINRKAAKTNTTLDESCFIQSPSTSFMDLDSFSNNSNLLDTPLNDIWDSNDQPSNSFDGFDGGDGGGGGATGSWDDSTNYDSSSDSSSSSDW